jgi:hypothetical protein
MLASTASTGRWRPGRKLVIAGVVVSMLAVLGYLTAIMYAVMYLPICQRGEHWSQEGACAVLRVRHLALVGVLGVGIAITFVGFVRSQRDRRERPPAGRPRGE